MICKRWRELIVSAKLRLCKCFGKSSVVDGLPESNGYAHLLSVFSLLTAKTYEMHMFHSASLKLGLERAVLSQNREQAGDESDDNCNKVKKKIDREAQAKEIDQLLKKGAYDVFRDDDDKEAEKFMETDIDQLLKHSSRKVTYGDSAGHSSGLGSFSKASFVANTEDGQKDVDLDDPEFWAKAVGLEEPVETPDEIAAMIDDGIKRSRKQVQVYDPYAETVEAEKMKKERLAVEKMLEREEKERARVEKAQKKKEAQLKRRRERDAEKAKEKAAKEAPKEKVVEVVKKAPPKEMKPKKTKKGDRQLAIRRAENEDPVLERLKQAWEVPQRAKATAAAIRFGFGRFCKLRSESNLSSLPLQDLEIFFRCYAYQLALQVAVILLVRIEERPETSYLRPLFQEWLGVESPHEVDWLCESVQTVMKMHLEVEGRRRCLRMPAILVEPSYVSLLRDGAAFRGLRRIGFLARLNRFVEECIDSILSALGHEELGKRGCAAYDLGSLDIDLKARYISTEELFLAISSRFQKVTAQAPASWWDRLCDVGLLVGTFVHGLGNYEVMRNDFDLPFAHKLQNILHEHDACRVAADVFRVATSSARKTFDDALEAARIKAELEVQAAVAAAARAASKREEDAALLRKGGIEAEAVASSMPDTQVENAFEFDGTDSHFVTLSRMHKDITEGVRNDAIALPPAKVSAVASMEFLKREGEYDDDSKEFRLCDHQRLPMPDARVLDHRLMLIFKEIESREYSDETEGLEDSNPDLWCKSDDVLTNIQARAHALSIFVDKKDDRIREFWGVGLGASQCATSHRTLNDGTDYGFGSASPQLSQIAYGTDAPRFLRAIGVPMNVTRYAVSGLLYAESHWVQQLLDTEHLRFFGDEVSNANVSSPATKISETSAACAEAVVLGPATSGEENDEEIKDAATKEEGVETRIDDDILEQPGDAVTHVETVVPVDPVERIAVVFRVNAKLRANVCLAVIYFGLPSSDDLTVQSELWAHYQEQSESPMIESPPLLFSYNDFREKIAQLAPDLDIPDSETIRSYIESVLLPHCVRLCVYGNGPTTRGARGSEGKYETSFGVSLHPEISKSHPTPLPDPCMCLQDHSLEALGQANALLRRVRLLRSCQHICADSSLFKKALTVVCSDTFDSIEDMPHWWCPRIHDTCFLVQAAKKGLFAVIPDRASHSIFSADAVESRLYQSLCKSKDQVVQRSTPAQIARWTRRQAQRFPTLNQLERRLAFLCARVTSNVMSEKRFDCIPMFDHGGWPRN
jgi:hypothetical protein